LFVYKVVRAAAPTTALPYTTLSCSCSHPYALINSTVASRINTHSLNVISSSSSNAVIVAAGGRFVLSLASSRLGALLISERERERKIPSQNSSRAESDTRSAHTMPIQTALRIQTRTS